MRFFAILVATQRDAQHGTASIRLGSKHVLSTCYAHAKHRAHSQRARQLRLAIKGAGLHRGALTGQALRRRPCVDAREQRPQARPEARQAASLRGAAAAAHDHVEGGRRAPLCRLLGHASLGGETVNIVRVSTWVAYLVVFGWSRLGFVVAAGPVSPQAVAVAAESPPPAVALLHRVPRWWHGRRKGRTSCSSGSRSARRPP